MRRSRLINRSTVMLTFAVLAGLLAAWSARQHIQGRIKQLEAQARVPEVERIVAASDLPAGTWLGSAHLAVRAFPAALAPSDSLDPARYTELEGKVLRAPLSAGDLVLPLHVRQHQGGAFSTTLPSGRRAITMPVDAINSVSGLLKPGDLIDLYVSFEYQRRRITAPLLQGVLVLATGTTTHTSVAYEQSPEPFYGADGAGFTTVTLDVAPEDAVKLVAARQGGTITAILRNPADAVSSTKASRGDLATLLGLNVEGPPPRGRDIPVLYGNTSIRRVPRLQALPPRARQATGVFDLPYRPELTSAWLLSGQAGHGSGADLETVTRQRLPPSVSEPMGAGQAGLFFEELE